ncbi:cation diffusion facilitator family transporter [Mariniluteicoccus endophyticus]
MGHDHSHGAHASRARLLGALALTLVVVAAQAIGAFVTGSLALLTDTGHALVDASGLVIATIAATLMLRPASSRHTWGFARVEVVAALAQAAVLLVVGVFAAVEGVRRLIDPPDVTAEGLLLFGIIGLAANLASLALLSGGRDANLNMRAAFLEVLNDSLGSVAVIVAAVVIRWTGFTRADALAALFIAVLILPRAFRIASDALHILMEFSPAGVDLDDVRAHIAALDHVREVHDLHASTVGTGLPVLTGHVVVDDGCFRDGHAPRILEDIHACVQEHFPVSFEHATIQLEPATRRCETMHP